MTAAQKMTHRGSCLCKGIDFEVFGDPETCIQCYCEHCQKNAGGPYQVCAKFDQSQVRIVQGEQLVKYVLLTDTTSGHPKKKVFCGECGCTLWTIPMRHGGLHRIVRTSLLQDGLARFPPRKIYFASRNDQTNKNEEALTSFSTMPGF